jgi:tetratricopeptide (TPR) repeat protein
MFSRALRWLIGLAIFIAILRYWTRPDPDAPGVHLEQGLAAHAAGDYPTAEKHLREELRIVPGQRRALERLAVLLLESGRSWEALKHIQPLLTLDGIPHDSLLLFTADPAQVINERALGKWNQAHPDDHLALTGLAKIAFARGETKAAQTLLERALKIAPYDIEACILRGRMLLATSPEQMLSWHQELPENADKHPGIWFVRGEWCQASGKTQMAIRCLAEGLRLDPNDRGANHRLGQLLGESGKLFVERSENLQELFDTVTYVANHDQARSWHVVEMLEALGRFREAAEWGQITMTANAGMMMRMTKDAQFAKAYQHILSQARHGSDFNPALQLAVQQYPEWKPGEIKSQSDSNASPELLSRLKFRDDAAASGLNFSYFNADDPATDGMRMQELTGGGVGVLDADSDGWPDVYLTQGCVWPPGTDASRTDKLFLNRRGRSFSDVADSAGLGDPEFGQGVSVADFNNDGFDDILVGNIGANRLYFGNGDGTFSDMTEPSGIVGNDWTSSCASGDFNGDSLTDLFVVNYLHGNKVYEAICYNQNIAVTCAPSNFEATADQLWINLGDGRFEDQSQLYGIDVPGGPGLGIVVANLNSDQRLDVFVANDQKANFCFLNQPTEVAASGKEPLPRFQEQAILSGLAFDREGKAQACMGVAAGDVNADGTPDIFVTNFVNEYNTLYLSQPGGVFLDSSLTADLAGPSYKVLGFGTSFLDGDLDGRLDLVVANGHIGDHRHFGQGFRMQPQVFSNTGTLSSPRFAEVRAEDAGSYFKRELLGRGLAVLDWNRDGRPDFCVSHLDAPVAVLTNESPDVGHFVAIRLCGVDSSRDAIGTRLRVLTGGQSSSLQLMSGTSFQSSSQRYLLIGLADATKIDELILEWPSGELQSFRDIVADQMLTIVEGRPTLMTESDGFRQ